MTPWEASTKCMDEAEELRCEKTLTAYNFIFNYIVPQVCFEVL